LRPGVKKKDRQINIAKPINLIRALMVTVKIRNIRARILIDFEYLGNFMSSNFIKKAQFHTQTKGYQYTLYGIDDQLMTENGGTVTKEIILISVDI
jgi:hypothetical protein